MYVPLLYDRLDICKHIWAVLLAAEERGLPLLPPGTPLDAVALEPVDPDEGLPDEIDDDLGEDLDAGWLPWEKEGTTERRSAAKRASISDRMKMYWAERRTAARGDRESVAPPFAGPSMPKVSSLRQVREAPSPWRQLFDRITGTPPHGTYAPRPRLASCQLLYVIDTIASRASGMLVLELMTRDRKANGEWGKPKAATVTASDVHTLPACDDRRILEKLLGAQPYYDWSTDLDYSHNLDRVRVGGVLVSEIVPLLCATGRCLARVEESATMAAPLQLEHPDANPVRPAASPVHRRLPPPSGPRHSPVPTSCRWSGTRVPPGCSRSASVATNRQGATC